MRHSFLKGALVGGIGATVVMAASIAWAANGGNFILGQSNSATNVTGLSGSSANGMLSVTDTHTSATAPAIQGRSNTANQAGVRGTNTVASGFGVIGTVDGTAGGAGIGTDGRSTNGTGIRGIHSGTTGAAPGVLGLTRSAAGPGVRGTSPGVGVSATGGTKGVDANVSASGAVGIVSTAGASANDAVQGNTSNAVGDALQGITSGSAAFAVFGISTGTGVGGVFSTAGGTGVSSSSGGGVGASAQNSSSSNPAVFARNSTAGGTAGSFTGDTALNVENNGTFGIGLNATVTGDTDGNGNASDDGNDAIYAQSDDTNNDAVITANTAAGSTELSHEAIETSGFLDVNGNARVTGNLNVVGSCCGPTIDYPLDPANYYLRHASVASSDMKNMYDGIATTDRSGSTTVQLPEWFGAFNRDFRYQLTVIGDFAQAIVSREIPDGGRTFEIRTSKPGVKVSWQVTGIRNDAYAQAHPLKVVDRKTGAVAGMYLHPELFGHSGERPLGLDLPTPPESNTAALLRAQADLAALTSAKAKQAIEDAQVEEAQR